MTDYSKLVMIGLSILIRMVTMIGAHIIPDNNTAFQKLRNQAKEWRGLTKKHADCTRAQFTKEMEDLE